MRIKPIVLAVLTATASLHAYAEESPNIIRTPAMINVSINDDQFWQQIDAYITDWENLRAEYGCSVWSPDPASQTIGSTFLQARSCSQDQQRFVQQREQNENTKTIRDVGEPSREQRTIGTDHTREAIGRLETWVATSPEFTDWKSVSGAYACSGWKPDPSGYTKTTSFTQTSANCVVDQARERQNREEETTTGDIRNAGNPITESRELSGQSASRPYTVTLGEWADQGAKQSCSNWAPPTSTVGLSKPFVQTASDCKQDQVRARTEQYTDHLTGQKVVVANTTEKQTLTVSDTRDAVGTLEAWANATATYTEWMVSKGPYSCANWTPSGSGYTSSASFTQTSSTCSIDQTRNRQDREQESNTGTYRDKGSVVVENRTLTKQSDSRPYEVALGAWTNSGAVTSCSNWSPAPTTVTVGSAFTQTATDCKQAQNRTRVEKYTDNESHQVVTALSSSESRSIAASSTRSATGTKETWLTAAPTYTAWANNGSVNSCSNWSPAPATVTVGQSFTQTATDCLQPQTRTRQDREQETTTKAIRNKGAAVTETQSITASSTRSAVGTKETWAAITAIYSTWANSGTVASCTNWSPATSTVTVGSTFTQTATDCDQKQTRTRQDREQESTTKAIRNKGAAVTETQTIKASSTRSATGTKETWVATTSTYTAWANNGAVNSCLNWSPATSTVTINTAFTQTATDCKQPQNRTRQDREQETTTKAIRNKGAAVTESQIITASSTRSATGTKETWVATTSTYGAWTNSGALYSCTNWSPAGSAYSSSANFNQTATNCSLNQTRTAQARQKETTTGAIRNSGSPTTENRTLANQTATRAYGVTIGAWQNNGAVANCSNWSPDPSAVNAGTAFTQTATNCTQAQVRSRVEQYKDHATGVLTTVVNTTESQTVAASSARTATGTKSTQQCQTGGWIVTAEAIGPMGPRPVLRLYWGGTLLFTNASYNGVDSTMVYGGYTYTRGTQYNGQTWNMCRQ
ncbi:hypothetical protein [Pseudomonas amygdali]|uniref:Uncharacterized protein n=2 Tax=Pseudomonas amygdali pv. lachrymans TaxID=53707 RepID=A0ABR5KQU6_PSEAV|nr:hypothetical protein [Pseudomonas amygdali]AXH59592.1 hypothetical protein PLA107_030670 [Pseudomonas amygdali pv. lachrymans str. M301315]KPC17018.1 Uncharacterized protein AC499_0220 [Pseudomonas amygdali pv. lachrymans]KPC17977.1 Uncharacterized protein AC499_1179 [Pseudomonas amygdali pv. lachrymans]RMT05830.1 hypothetical protein ALP54_03513 [Pseudomonas amygdali pv. lachrymans]